MPKLKRLEAAHVQTHAPILYFLLLNNVVILQYKTTCNHIHGLLILNELLIPYGPSHKNGAIYIWFPVRLSVSDFINEVHSCQNKRQERLRVNQKLASLDPSSTSLEEDLATKEGDEDDDNGGGAVVSLHSLASFSLFCDIYRRVWVCILLLHALVFKP